MPNTIAIFPAAGGLGGATLSHLLKTSQINPSSLVLIARHPEKLEEERKSGVDVRRGDFDDLESLQGGVFKGVEVLNLISYPSLGSSPPPPQVAKAAIDAAIKDGVKHIFYSSLAFARAGPPSFKPHVMLAHLDTEAYLESLASPTFSYTIVRQGLYSESFPVYTSNFDLKQASSSSDSSLTIRIPLDGAGRGISWAKRDELGEATARLLKEYAMNPSSFRFNNKLIILSGPREYTLNETAEVFSKVLGKDVKIQQVTVDEYVDQAGVGYRSDSTELDRLWATAFEGIRQGEAGSVTGYLGELLGREPEDFETTIRGMLEG